MYKILNITVHLLYKHYLGGGTKSIAYESALMTFTFFIMIHILQIKVLFFGGGVTFGSTKLIRFISISVIFIPIYLILTRLFRKQDIVGLENKYLINYKKGYAFIIVYCIITFGLLTYLILLDKNLV